MAESDVIVVFESEIEAPTSLQRLTSLHHMAAQLLAKGEEVITVALQTGYTPTYVSMLQRDPLFKELMEHYKTERNVIFVDVLERMKAVGGIAGEELQRRLTENPGKFSNRELVEIIDTAIPKGTSAPPAGVAVSPTFNISFAQPPQSRALPGEMKVIQESDRNDD